MSDREAEAANVAPPRKSVMGSGAGYNEKMLEWQRKQDETAVKDEVIEMFLHVNDGVLNYIPTPEYQGVENKPALFFPDPDKAQQVNPLPSPSIWDLVVIPNTTPLPPEIINPPLLAEKVDNKPTQFTPNPEAIQKLPPTIQASIWDVVIPKATPPSPETINPPRLADRVDNKPLQFTPDPEAAQKLPPRISASIWDVAIPRSTETASPLDSAPYIPQRNDGVENHPDQFTPDPKMVQEITHVKTYSIWDNVVFVNNKKNEGLFVSINGGKIDKLDSLDLRNYEGFKLVLPGGDEIEFYKGNRRGSTRRVSSLVFQALYIYKDVPEFFDTIEGPLLVLMYWLRARGMTMSEIRLLEK